MPKRSRCLWCTLAFSVAVNLTVLLGALMRFLPSPGDVGNVRRLQLLGRVAPSNSVTSGIGCVTMTIFTDTVLDLSGTPCNGQKCPPCFILEGEGTYVNSAVQAEVCPIGSETVWSAKQCEAAAIAEGGVYRGAESDSAWPYGCFTTTNAGVKSFWFGTYTYTLWTDYESDGAHSPTLICQQYHTLTLFNCGHMRVSASKTLDTFSANAGVASITFMNVGSSGNVAISDGETKHMITPGSVAQALCTSFTEDTLHFLSNAAGITRPTLD